MGQAHTDQFWNYYGTSYLRAELFHRSKHVQSSGICARLILSVLSKLSHTNLKCVAPKTDRETLKELK